jgi:hypothetical protein
MTWTKIVAPIPVEEALRRVDAILPMLYQDVWIALRLRCVMDAANQIAVPLFEKPSYVGDTLAVVTNSMHVRLALDLARIYDVGTARRLDDQDKASIPILAHHLERIDVREKLCGRAKWPKGTDEDSKACADALDVATMIKAIMARAPVGPALKRLKEFRDRRLAHRLYDKEPEELPTFDDLFLLTNTARTFAEVAGFAIARRRRLDA